MAHSAYVMKVRDNKILINMEGIEAQVGEIYYIMDLSARKRGLTKVLKARNQKAIANFVGEAKPGWDLVLKQKASESDQENLISQSKGYQETQPTENNSFYNKNKFIKNGKDFIGGYISGYKDSLEITGSDLADLAGTNFGASVFYNYSFHPRFSFRVEGGYSRFNLDNGDKNIEAHYANLGVTTMFVFPLESSFRPWLGTHSAIYFPFSKKSNVVSDTSISTSILYGLSAGVDYISPDGKFILPVSFEYSLFPSSQSIKSRRIAVKIGFGIWF